MDKKLKTLFDYQKFTQEPSLEGVIRALEPDFVCELDDESLFAVAGGKQDKYPSNEEPKQPK